MKKILVTIITVILLISALASCNSVFEDVTYREGGISFTLPNTMRKSESSDYDFYFTNTVAVFTAKRLDLDFLERESLSADISAKGYIDHLMEKNGLDIANTEYKYDEERDLHNFRYSIESTESTFIYYVVVTGEPENVWYIEMCCMEEYFEDYLPTFGEWKRSISAYKE